MGELHVDKTVIYYTDNRLPEPLFSVCQKHVAAAGLPIVSCSLRPLAFGRNVVVESEPGYPAMIRQIIRALEISWAQYVFFCEHDVLYHRSHFDFAPTRNDTYYYNVNVWRWKFKSPTAVTWDDLKSLSGLCCNRELALDHFQRRLDVILARPEEFQTREPKLPRVWGYEPGTKKRRRGGFSDEDYSIWRSAYPNIDIRHNRTYSPPKITLDSFKHKPTGWQEVCVEGIPGWNLKELFK